MKSYSKKTCFALLFSFLTGMLCGCGLGEKNTGTGGVYNHEEKNIYYCTISSAFIDSLIQYADAFDASSLVHRYSGYSPLNQQLIDSASSDSAAPLVSLNVKNAEWRYGRSSSILELTVCTRKRCWRFGDYVRLDIYCDETDCMDASSVVLRSKDFSFVEYFGKNSFIVEKPAHPTIPADEERFDKKRELHVMHHFRMIVDNPRLKMDFEAQNSIYEGWY